MLARSRKQDTARGLGAGQGGEQAVDVLEALDRLAASSFGQRLKRRVHGRARDEPRRDTAKPHDLLADGETAATSSARSTGSACSGIASKRATPRLSQSSSCLRDEARFASRLRSASVRASSRLVRIAGDNGGRMSIATAPTAMPARIALALFQNCDAS